MRGSDLLKVWNRFWFGPENPKTLSLLRIGWGLVLFSKYTGCYGLYRLPGVRFLLPRHEFDSVSEFPIHPEGYSPSYPLFAWLPQPSFAVYQYLEVLLLVFSVLFFLGFLFRLTGPIMACLVGYQFACSPFLYHHHTFQMAIVTAILGFSQSARVWSVDSWLFGKRAKGGDLDRMPRRLLQVLVTVTYFFTSISKMNEGWLSGEIIEVFRASGSMRGPVPPWVFEHFSYEALGLITVWTEFFLVFGLWIPRVRYIAAFAGVGLHIGIDSMMAVGTFSYQMIVLYLVFLLPFGASQESEEVSPHSSSSSSVSVQPKSPMME